MSFDQNLIYIYTYNVVCVTLQDIVQKLKLNIGTVKIRFI